MTEADRLYTQLWSRVTGLWARAQTFRRISELGLPTATARIAKDNSAFAMSLLTDPEYKNLFKGPVENALVS
jgi:hypothetical protein